MLIFTCNIVEILAQNALGILASQIKSQPKLALRTNMSPGHFNVDGVHNQGKIDFLALHPLKIFALKKQFVGPWH